MIDPVCYNAALPGKMCPVVYERYGSSQPFSDLIWGILIEEGIHIWYYKLSKKKKSGEAIDLSGELTVIVLKTEHVVKLPTEYLYLNPWINTILFRKASFLALSSG